MIKTRTHLEVKVGERIYSLECEIDSPLGELFDALCQFQSFVIEKINESQKTKEEPKE